MIRADTRTGRLLPSGWTCRSCNARKSFACVGRGRLTISSRKRLPPSASWNCRSEEHTSELQSQSNLVCRLLLEKKKKKPREISCADLWSQTLIRKQGLLSLRHLASDTEYNTPRQHFTSASTV